MSRQTVGIVLAIFIIGIGNSVKATCEEEDKIPKGSTASPPALRTQLKSVVECYACVNCAQVDDQNKTCPFNIDAYKMRRCVTYAEKYPHIDNGKDLTWIIRGCASERGSCEDIKKAYSNNSPGMVQLEYCKECEGDRCNSVYRSVPDMLFAFFAVVLSPILTKYTLS